MNRHNILVPVSSIESKFGRSCESNGSSLAATSRSDAAYLSARGLGEPESPLVLEGVLDIEVIFVVEDRHGLAVVLGLAGVLSALGGDGDGGEIDLLVHVGCLRRSSSHCCYLGRAGVCEVLGGLWL